MEKLELNINFDPNEIENAVRSWFESVVLGLNLCPFAHQPAAQGRVRFIVLAEPNKIFEIFTCEIELLSQLSKDQLETTLIIAPQGFEDFWWFNETSYQMNTWLAQQGHEGFVQIATFHPDYQFAGTKPEDASNLTNRSPYPIFHLLREQSLEEIINRGADTDSIPERNIETVCKLTAEQKRRLFPYLDDL